VAVELYVVRHAIAEPRGDAWPDDAKRPLTDEGIARFKKAVRGLAALDVTIDVILTSPLVRAKQTAELLAAGLSGRGHITAIESLAPGGSFASILADLEKQAKRSSVALVGHEPDIGEIAARLVGSKTPFSFKKGGVCRIDVDALPPSGAGTLRWFMPPKLLRRIR
jgi:phosphohistidine phosphatase